MGDLISRQAVIKTIERANGALYWNNTLMKNLVLTMKAIPTVDAVPVVRCKDCKWFGDMGCAIRIVDDSDKPTENDFCSFAERSEDERTD